MANILQCDACASLADVESTSVCGTGMDLCIDCQTRLFEKLSGLGLGEGMQPAWFVGLKRAEKQESAT